MGTKTNTGFTIIETMLFLAVAGALAAAVLVGSGVAINQQRYKDSVNSLKSFIQTQYSEVTNVVNDRQGSEACNASAVVVQPPGSVTPQSRGTSECILLGRFVSIDSTGTRLTASNVVGYRTPGAPEAASDILEITTNYRMGLSTISQETADVAWGATIVRKQTTQPAPTSILILQSPLSGSIMTYVSQGTVTNLRGMVAVGNSDQATDLCVNAPVGTFQGSRLSVRLSPFATSQGAIQVPLESENVCD